MIRKIVFKTFHKSNILLRNRNYNFYDVLGVEKNSTNEQIKSAYLKLAKQYHPDLNKDEGAEEKFKSLTSAYEALNNQRNRDLYDAYMYSDPYTDNNYEYDNKDYSEEKDNFYQEKAKWDKFSDKFKSKKESDFWGKKGSEGYEQDFFKDFDNIFSSGYKTKKASGEDILLEIKISFEEAFNGVLKGVKINNRREICSSCKGTKSIPGFKPSKCFSCSGTGETRSSILGGNKCKMCKGQGFIIKNPCKLCKGVGTTEREVIEPITIPPGIKSDTILKVEKKGHCSDNQKIDNGDLLVKVIVETSDNYKRIDDNLIVEKQISLKDAIFGCDIEVPILLNNNVRIVNIPPQTQPNKEIKLSSLGFIKSNVMNTSNNSVISRGDQIVKIIIKIPDLSNLNKSDKEEFKKLLDKLI